MHISEFTIQILGVIGAIIFLISYVMVSTEQIKTHSIIYQLMNLVGSIIFVINAIYFKTYGPLALNICWGVIALYMLIKVLRNPAGSCS